MNKILYLEDLHPESIKDDLEKEGFVVDVDNTENLQATLNQFRSGEYDAYFMDYRLTEVGTGMLEAPAFAVILRSDSKIYKSRPIILVTNDNALNIVQNDQSKQDLFDVIITKSEFNHRPDRACLKINGIIDFYRTIESYGYNLSVILGTNKVDEYLDFRLLHELECCKEENKTYEYVRLIYNYLIRSVGALIGKDYLASRLGVDIESVEKIKHFLDPFKYKGVMSSYYDRWWMNGVFEFWESLGTNTNLRCIDAETRVEILKEKLSIDLNVAKAGFAEESTEFWSVCVASKQPVDPSDAFICNDRLRKPWEENEYISMKGVLENPTFLKKLSKVDQSEILAYGNQKK